MNLKRQLKNWIELYSPMMFELLRRLEGEISNGLSRAFEEQLQVKSGIHMPMSKEYGDLTFKVEKPSDSLVTSGVIVGGASQFY